jgi:hypothetical protein
MFIPAWKMISMSLLGIPFYWGRVRTPYRDIQTAKYPILTSLICGTLYVLPIYLRNAAIQSRDKEIRFLEHAFPFAYTLAIGFLILLSVNCMMIAFYYWLFITDKGTSDQRWIRALRTYHSAAFYQILLFAGYFWAWRVDYSQGIVVLIVLSCLKLAAVYAGLYSEIKKGGLILTPESLVPEDIGWVCKLGVLCGLDVGLIWLTI